VVKICVVCFLAVSTLLHGTEPPPGGASLAGTLYDEFMQPFREGVQEVGNFNGKPLQVYEHLDPTREIETRTYLRFAPLEENGLVTEFMNGFLEMGAGVDSEVVRSILKDVVSRDVGRLEIQLLMTKMSMQKTFWDMVVKEINSRAEAFNKAVEDFKEDDEAKVSNVLSASYRAGNLLKFLLNPCNPGSITAAELGDQGITNVFWRNFSSAAGNEGNINAFFSAISSEQAWDISHVGEMIINPENGNVPTIDALLCRMRSTASRAANVFSKLYFAVPDVNEGNCFSHQVCALNVPNRCSKVKIDFSLYDENSGVAKNGGYYCYARVRYETTKKNVGAQHRTVHSAVFHEFDHALHWVEGRNSHSSSSLDRMYGVGSEGVKKWRNDEEFLTILGLSYNDVSDVWFFDPLSCAAFSLSGVNGYEVNIRCFHAMPSGRVIDIRTGLGNVPVFVNMSDNELLELFMCGMINRARLERR
jgi:hypothetical protein